MDGIDIRDFTINSLRHNIAMVFQDNFLFSGTIRENILMGYYDTLKIVKNLDGYKYIFKNKSDSYYRFLIRKVSKKKLKEMQKLFRTINDKKLVLKALEYVMDKENFSYYEVYSSMKVIKKVKKLDKDYGVYNFVKKMQFL